MLHEVVIFLNNYIVRTYRFVIVVKCSIRRRTIKVKITLTLRKDLVILQLYWWLFISIKHCGRNMV